MTRDTARYKNPMPVAVMMAATLALGYAACFGMISDNEEIARTRNSAAPVERVVTPRETKARQIVALYGTEGEDWYGEGCGRDKCKGVR